MKTRLIISAIAALSVFSAKAQEVTDTIQSHELNEVVVHASTERALSTHTSYVPLSNQKQTAQTATALLESMAIPQISITPDGGVETLAGQEISIFIDMLPATQDDLKGMRTADVKRVDYYDFPTDPRFQGARHAINFVMHKYSYGGYTKLYGAAESAGGDIYTSIYSKMTYNAMTYDLFGSYDFYDSKHRGEDGTGTFYFPDFNGTPIVIKRMTKQQSAKTLRGYYYLTFRASYNSKRFRVVNLLGGSWMKHRANNETGQICYSPEIYDTMDYSDRQHSNTNGLSYKGDFYGDIGGDWSSNLQLKASYSRTNNHNHYQIGDHHPILNNAKEDAWDWRGDWQLNKKFNTISTFIAASYGQACNSVDYSGDTDSHNFFRLAFGTVGIGASVQISKIYLSGDTGYAGEWSTINGNHINDGYPYVHFNGQYTPSQKISAQIWFQYATNSPGQSEKTSTEIQQNELMWITGNPSLKNARHTTIYPSVTWFAGNNLSFTGYAYYFSMYDRIIPIYTPDGKRMIRSYTNNGDYNNLKVGIKGSLRLFDRKFLLSASIYNDYWHTTGLYKNSLNHFGGDLSADYYLKDFYFGLYWRSEKKSLDLFYPQESMYKDFFRFHVGWSHGDWNIKAVIYNPYRYNWRYGTKKLTADTYNSDMTVYGTTSRFDTQLCITYTIGYGKRVERNNEVGATSGSGSAILK